MSTRQNCVRLHRDVCVVGCAVKGGLCCGGSRDRNDKIRASQCCPSERVRASFTSSCQIACVDLAAKHARIQPTWNRYDCVFELHLHRTRHPAIMSDPFLLVTAASKRGTPLCRSVQGNPPVLEVRAADTSSGKHTRPVRCAAHAVLRPAPSRVSKGVGWRRVGI